MKTIDMPPFAPTLMESTRAIGYSLEAAVADIIDNSIAAKASKVSIHFSPYDALPYVSILDNGEGMSEDEINNAMRYGSQSSLDERDSSDLGRFGLGLKTASLSQCRRLTVISKRGTNVVARRWDLDEVYRTGSWSLICLDEDDLFDIPQFEKVKMLEQGTLVLWEKLDKMLKGTSSPDRLMNKQMDEVRDHISLVFHRYLSGEAGLIQLDISINELPVKPMDPFLIGRSTKYQADENYDIDGEIVSVSAYMLPHINSLTREEKKMLGGTEGLTKNQGFYVYRNKRLLVWGTWFRLHRKDSLSKLARIQVDVPNSLDHLWTLDVKKSTAVPPDVIRDQLAKVVGRVSEGSKRTWTFRGKREVSDVGNHLWTKTAVRDGIVYNLNREHVILEMLGQSLDPQQKILLDDYIKLVEDNLPLNQLYVDLNNEEQINIKKEGEEEKQARAIAETAVARLSGNPNKQAVIAAMIATDPFCNFKSIVSWLEKELENE